MSSKIIRVLITIWVYYIWEGCVGLPFDSVIDNEEQWHHANVHLMDRGSDISFTNDNRHASMYSAHTW